ncbi:threonine synthase [Amycolatopsis jejuensis]|uniref:threonine synthase n=1 Tax=Amycolatopsis jejuensis TaxID=330084 RepID=UPI000527E65A|nr:pyridoxal-phosphate dependent enzyme [Amycolatopsis jejuensis]
MAAGPFLRCTRCGSEHSDREPIWHCLRCGGPLEVSGLLPGPADDRRSGVWQYPSMTGLHDARTIVSLGEQSAPIVPDPVLEGVSYHLQQLSPTGSYKDRGVSVLVSKAKEWGVRSLVEDSSGNAGASVAAYCAAAGIKATIVVPAATSAGKRAQISAFGAEIVLSRDRGTAATVAAELDATYLGHNWSPYFLAGLTTTAPEIVARSGGRAPQWIVLPVGAGTLLLGVHRGMKMLAEAGHLAELPRLLAVQAESCAPIADAWRTGAPDVPAVPVSRPVSVAEGIAVPAPVRGAEVLAAIRESNGACVTVGDAGITAATRRLALQGIFAEPTSGAALAGLQKARTRGTATGSALVVITGTGLKTLGGATPAGCGR